MFPKTASCVQAFQSTNLKKKLSKGGGKISSLCFKQFSAVKMQDGQNPCL